MSNNQMIEMPQEDVARLCRLAELFVELAMGLRQVGQQGQSLSADDIMELVGAIDDDIATVMHDK